MKQSPLQPYYWVLISGFTFSWMATFSALAGKGCGWQVVALVRCLIPLLVVALWAKLDGVRFAIWGPPVLWLRSLAGSCSLIGTFYAFHILPLTDIYTVANTFPIWVALLSWPMVGKIPSLSVWIAVVCSVLGVVVIQGPDIKEGNFAVLIVVAVSLFTAIAMMGLNRLQGIDPRAIVVHFSATALVFSIVCFFVFPWETSERSFTSAHFVALLDVGLTATFGQFFLTRAFTSGDAAKLSVATLSQFVFVLVLDIVVLGHPLEWHKLWGIPLIIGPTVWLMLQRADDSLPPADRDFVPTESIEPLLPVCRDCEINSE